MFPYKKHCYAKKEKNCNIIYFWDENLKNQALITIVVIPINGGAKGNKKIISNRLTLLCKYLDIWKSNTRLFNQAFKWNDQFKC
jgi:hypothetical protein